MGEATRTILERSTIPKGEVGLLAETIQITQGEHSMRTLGLDLGTKTGWAINTTSNNRLSGTWDLTPRRGDSGAMRYLELQARLNKITEACPDLELVIFEAPHHRGGYATEILLGLATHVQSWAAERKIATTTIHSNTLKKHATGHGRSGKELVMRAAKNRGWSPKSFDEADALFILDYALKTYGGNDEQVL